MVGMAGLVAVEGRAAGVAGGEGKSMVAGVATQPKRVALQTRTYAETNKAVSAHAR